MGGFQGWSGDISLHLVVVPDMRIKPNIIIYFHSCTNRINLGETRLRVLAAENFKTIFIGRIVTPAQVNGSI